MLALALGGAEVRFTTRDDGDLADARARERVLRACGLESIVGGRQVHGIRVVTVSAAEPGYRIADGPADGQATALPGVGVTVHVADCLPIAVAGAGGVAMLHAGWRGLAGGVVAEGVAALRRLGVAGPLAAAIGPGAGGCCYEVGPDVAAAFGSSRAGLLDLKAVARHELARAGVEDVDDVGVCTLCAPAGLVFSHRRDGPGTGRQAGIAWLR